MTYKNVTRRLATIASFTGFSALAAPQAGAASLQLESGWDTRSLGFPADVSMYAYVPDGVRSKPPILALIRNCDGDGATKVFAKAAAAGLVAAADDYGFIIVVPEVSLRCWDNISDQTWTRDAQGDSHAIALMVRFAVSKYNANPARVYATGEAQGAMMTQLLLAVYPDVFKAGSAFAGMPAGCRAPSEAAKTYNYSALCAAGEVTHSGAEWGAIVSKMDPGYTGHRPRVQLFHGDADVVINYANFTEAIKEWTNVLGLSTTPTSTEASTAIGSHQATRQQWKNDCGFVGLDAFTFVEGDHALTDAVYNSQYVIPFLGLDKTGEVDPEISMCAGSTGGTSGSGGTSAGGTTGIGGASEGGAEDAGGARASAGTAGTAPSSGGWASGGGGAVALGGANPGVGGSAIASGAAAIGGSTSDTAGKSSAGGSNSTGCSFTVARSTTASNSLIPLVAAAALCSRRRRRRP